MIHGCHVQSPLAPAVPPGNLSLVQPARMLLVAALLAAGCGEPAAAVGTTTTGITTVQPGSTDPASSSSSSSSSGSSGQLPDTSTSGATDTSTGSAPPDLPEFETLGPVKGCGKIDILFVITDGGSLINEVDKIRLAADAKVVRDAGNGFIAAMQEQAADYDLQVMVIKGDPEWPSTNGPESCCGKQDKPCDALGPYPCGGAWEDFTQCDRTLGTGVRYPTGYMASNRDCKLAGGHRYITEAQDDFATAFDCILNVGRSGAGQQHLGGMVKAVGPTLNGPDGCNAGFVRPDAMLVVVLITDEQDIKSPGTPEGLAASLIAAKAGYTDGIVVVGLLNSVDSDDKDQCADAPWERERMFVEGFPNHVIASFCAPDLGAELSEAIEVIQTACEKFVPPG